MKVTLSMDRKKMVVRRESGMREGVVERGVSGDEVLGGEAERWSYAVRAELRKRLWDITVATNIPTAVTYEHQNGAHPQDERGYRSRLTGVQSTRYEYRLR